MLNRMIVKEDLGAKLHATCAVKNCEWKSNRRILLQFWEEEDGGYKIGPVYFSKHSALIFNCLFCDSCCAFKTLTNATQAMTVKRFATILLVDTSALVMRDINLRLITEHAQVCFQVNFPSEMKNLATENDIIYLARKYDDIYFVDICKKIKYSLSKSLEKMSFDEWLIAISMFTSRKEVIRRVYVSSKRSLAAPNKTAQKQFTV